jgi:glutamate racemase
MDQATDHRPIGVYDSGVGGLSILQALREQLPGEALVYLADQARVPYGPRPIEDVRAFAFESTAYLVERGAKLLVVACNTASAAALYELRQGFSGLPIVGMEPAVKPAAEHTLTGVVGVLATPATFQGRLYSSVLERFAQGVTVLQHAPRGLVEQIEEGELDSPATRRILESALAPMIRAGIDTIVLGCTHYTFVIPLIRQIAGPEVRVIDPAPAIARQAGKVLAERGIGNGRTADGALTVLTTGPAGILGHQMLDLLGFDVPVTNVSLKTTV